MSHEETAYIHYLVRLTRRELEQRLQEEGAMIGSSLRLPVSVPMGTSYPEQIRFCIEAWLDRQAVETINPHELSREIADELLSGMVDP